MTRTFLRYAAVVALGWGITLVAGCGQDEQSTPEVSASATPSATASPALEPTATPSPSVSASTTITPGAPVAIEFPRLGATVSVADQPCPVVNGQLDPDRNRQDDACYYTAADKPYVLPSSDAKDIVVLAGHTIRNATAAFNPIYDWKAQKFAVQVGDELRVRTATSGDTWLVYRAESLHTPTKAGGLASDTTIWGTGPMPGRLLTIGCLQPTDLSTHSSRNVVVVWQYAGTAL